MGYTKDEDGNLIIVPEEAEIIKRIYREYLEGQSLVGIGRGLEKDGIFTAAGKPRWRPESVKKILQNEKYIGDALLQKTVTVDFLTKKRVKNEGHVPQYYVENSHEAIIPKELFLQVQEEIHRRSNIYTGASKNKQIYSSKYALSAITFCGDYGDINRRTYWNIHGRKEFVWRCVTRIEQGPEVCKNRTEEAQPIREEEKQKARILQEHIDQEKKKTREFLNILSDYKLANEIRKFVDILKESDKADQKTIEWMSRKADWIDPTISVEDELLGKREHHKADEEKDKFLKEEKYYW